MGLASPSLTVSAAVHWLTRCGPRRGLDSFSGKPRGSGPPAGTALPIEGVILSLQDLIGYFEPPSEELQHEEKQSKLRSLRNRQSLFQEEVRPRRERGGPGRCLRGLGK